MITVEARLTHGSTYFAGEDIECQLCFTNPPREEGGIRLSSDVETLAWATAQIHCQCTLSISNVPTAVAQLEGGAEPSPAVELSPSQTYFHPTKGERGVTVMMTQPKILFCNVRLAPGERTEYTYTEKLPLGNVPTFKGTFVKYSYKLTIGTQRPDSPISEIKIPFRVLTVDGLKDLSAYIDKNQELAPSNPFILEAEQAKPEHTIRDVALQLLSEQSARKRHNCYNISNQLGKVTKIIMAKTSYKIGEDLYCTFDFTDCSVQCLQITVTLQSMEELNESHRSEGGRHTNTINHTSHTEFCLHMAKANVALPIPLNITPNFKSEYVTLKWKMHIEFVTLSTSIPDQTPPESESTGVLWHGDTELPTETMYWDLPITILSNNPLQCGIIQTMKCDESINLD